MPERGSRRRTAPARRAVARVLAPALAAAVLGAGLAGCSGNGGGGKAGLQYVAGDGSIVVLPAPRRGEPVELAGTTLAGDRLDVASLRGHPAVLNVWGSWCPPCRKEAPDLQAAYTALRPRGVAFVGLNNLDPDAGPARAYERTFGITFPSLADPDGRLLLGLRGSVSPKAVPTTLVLDSRGRVAARVSGPTTRATLVGLVEDVLAEQA